MTSRRSSPSGFTVVPVALAQRQIGDWLDIAARRHTMHALLELDVTDARRAIREERAATGARLSFTAFVVACLARAIDEEGAPAARFANRLKELLEDGTILAEPLKTRPAGGAPTASQSPRTVP